MSNATLSIARVNTLQGISEVLLKMPGEKSYDQYFVCLLDELLKRPELMQALSAEDQSALLAYNKIRSNKFTN